MRIIGMALAISLFFSSLSIAQKLTTQMDSVSYSIGVMVASTLKSQGVDKVDAKSVADGINDLINGNELKMSTEEAQKCYQEFMASMLAQKNGPAKEAGEAYLAENAKKDGVTTMPSGLQYEVMNAGTGAMPTAKDKVRVHYHGTLIDGTVFDSSVDRGESITFPVTGVIQGWVEALQLMHVGDKWKLSIPYDLAYGERGAGGAIGPFAALIFEVELLGIE